MIPVNGPEPSRELVDVVVVLNDVGLGSASWGAPTEPLLVDIDEVTAGDDMAAVTVSAVRKLGEVVMNVEVVIFVLIVVDVDIDVPVIIVVSVDSDVNTVVVVVVNASELAGGDCREVAFAGLIDVRAVLIVGGLFDNIFDANDSDTVGPVGRLAEGDCQASLFEVVLEAGSGLAGTGSGSSSPRILCLHTGRWFTSNRICSTLMVYKLKQLVCKIA